MTPPSFTVQAAQLEDVPVIAQLCEDAFETDRQTQLKSLGKKPFQMKQYMLQSLPKSIETPKHVVLKAVDNVSGETVGFCNWGFHGFDPEDVPKPDGAPRAVARPSLRTGSDSKASSNTGEEKDVEDDGSDPIRRLESLTSHDMAMWMDDVMQEDTQCIFVIGLSVSPNHQGRGVGSALLQYGIDFCNERRVFAWVHSSESACKVYRKCGFQVVRSLDINLDDYAPQPPPGEGPDARWGHYVFRYMKYLP